TRRSLDGARDPDFHHLSRRRHRATLPDSYPVHRPDARGVPLFCLRPRPRRRDAGTARSEAAGLSAPRRTRRTGRTLRKHMRELVRTNDIVLISAIEALLSGANIEYVVLDQNMSVLEGLLCMLPRRILVEEARAGRARQLLQVAGLGHELRPDGG